MPLVSRVRGDHLLRDHATPRDCRHRIRTGCRVDAIHVSVAHVDRGRVITELLSRGSRVRISAGAPFPKDSASLFAESICRRTFIEQSDRSGEFAPHPGDFTITRFPQQNSSSYFGRVLHRAENDSWSPATNAGGRFTTRGADGIVCAAMNELRDLRRHLDLGQRDFADLLSMPLETFRPMDSGRRVASVAVLQWARDAVQRDQRQKELLSLHRLARELGVHIRTLQAAARTGRLETHFSVPVRFRCKEIAVSSAARAAARRGAPAVGAAVRVPRVRHQLGHRSNRTAPRSAQRHKVPPDAGDRKGAGVIF